MIKYRKLIKKFGLLLFGGMTYNNPVDYYVCAEKSFFYAII